MLMRNAEETGSSQWSQANEKKNLNWKLWRGLGIRTNQHELPR